MPQCLFICLFFRLPTSISLPAPYLLHTPGANFWLDNRRCLELFRHIQARKFFSSHISDSGGDNFLEQQLKAKLHLNQN